MPRSLYYCDQHELPLPAGHKFPAQKYRLLRDTLAESACFSFEPSPAADSAVLELVHDREYVRQFLAGTLEPAMQRRIGFPWSETLVQRALASVGGTLRASDDALATGWGGNLAGGTHHAFRDRGAGFCVFNDIAVAIQWLRLRGLIQRAAVLDLDVHQGDGTAHIFAADAGVFTASIHAQNNFPYRKQQSSVDVALPDGAGDDAFLRALDSVLPQVLAFRPHIVFYQSGVDGLATDIFGRLSLTPNGLRERDQRVLTAMCDARVPLVITLGGGYSQPIEITAQAHAETFRTAWRTYRG